MRDIGLVGVPFSGTSTLFTALESRLPRGQSNVAVVSVPDPRLAVLTEMERSEKTVPAQVRFVDVPGGVSSAQGLAKLPRVRRARGRRSLLRRRPASGRASSPTSGASCSSPTSR